MYLYIRSLLVLFVCMCVCVFIVVIVMLCLCTQHEEEPPQGVGKEAAGDQAEKLSKAALKNKRKREAKQRSKEQDVGQLTTMMRVLPIFVSGVGPNHHYAFFFTTTRAVSTTTRNSKMLEMHIQRMYF